MEENVNRCNSKHCNDVTSLPECPKTVTFAIDDEDTAAADQHSQPLATITTKNPSHIFTISPLAVIKQPAMTTIPDPVINRPAEAGWSSSLEFVFGSISYAVGLGNIWRFPYLCFKNGGGTFLFLYLVMFFLIGIPMFFLEMAFGQFASVGPLTIWKINPFFKGVGYAMLALSLLIPVYYNVVIAQCLLYLFMSLGHSLPWTFCTNYWNTPYCSEGTRSLFTMKNFTIPIDSNHSLLLTPMSTAAKESNNSGKLDNNVVGTKTEEFYFNFVLNQSHHDINDLGVPQWRLALCLLLCWTVVSLGLIRGAKGRRKLGYATALFPHVMLGVLLVQSCLLPGAADGIMYLLKPDWQRLAEPVVWHEAAVQVLFSLGCATGGLISLASFNKFKSDYLHYALVVPFFNAFTSILAGLVVFSLLGFVAFTRNTTINQALSSQGPGLAFAAYSEILTKMPIAPLWSTLFFLMMLAAGFGSVITVLEHAIKALQDDFPFLFKSSQLRTTIFYFFICSAGFLLGLPMVCQGGNFVVQLFDHYVPYIALVLIAFLEVISLAWIYDFPNYSFCDDIAMMTNRNPLIYFRITWRYVTPVALIFVLIATFWGDSAPLAIVSGSVVAFPKWAVGLGWAIASLPVMIIVVWMIFYHCFYGGFFLIKDHNVPMKNWGPRFPADRTGRYARSMTSLAKLQDVAKVTEENEDEARDETTTTEDLASTASTPTNSGEMSVSSCPFTALPQ